jgi:hypothetical protein
VSRKRNSASKHEDDVPGPSKRRRSLSVDVLSKNPQTHGDEASGGKNQDSLSSTSDVVQMEGWSVLNQALTYSDKFKSWFLCYKINLFIFLVMLQI